MPRPSSSRGVLLAVASAGLFSTSAVLVRLAAGFGPLEVASYRLLGGAGFVAVFAAIGRRSLAPPGWLDGPAASAGAGPLARFPAFVAAGLIAAFHFGFYVTSLYYTTVAHSLVLVNLSPILAWPLGMLFLKERFDPRRLPGVAAVIAGLAVMVGLEPALTRDMLLGDAMAFLAALAFAVYSLIGRGQRARSGLLAYTFRVYLVGGLALLPLALWSREAGPAGAAWGLPGLAAVLLLALVPTAGGHTLYNAALRRADAVTVNLIATQEVTGGVLLGALVLGEIPSFQAVVGGLVALGGLWLVLRR